MPDPQPQKPMVFSNTSDSTPFTNKRKSPSGPLASTNTPKRLRTALPSRQLATVPTSSTFPGNEVSVARFVRAREIEIRALEDGMRRAKKFQMRRAFQDVPRDMRRRTASHNSRRIPVRLRRRAVREMKEDQTPVKRGESGSGIGRGSKGRLRAEGMSKAKRGRAGRRNNGEEEMRHGNVVPVRDEAKATATGNESSKDTSSKKNVLANSLQARTSKVNRSAALKNPPTPPARFRKRQIHKTWLPTHMFHTKRAHMTAPSEPLWRFAIPLTPTAKSYRSTHRASTLRGAVAWDMSYIATIGLEGPEGSLVGLLKALGVGIDYVEDLWGDIGIGKKWRDGLRFWEGWTFERDSCPMEGIAPVTVIWCAKERYRADATDHQEGFSAKKREKRRAFIRVHPAGFAQLWRGVVRLAKVQKPAVSVEDLRFEIGSIEISGPGATEALCSALRPISSPEEKEFPAGSPQNIWKNLAILTNPGSLPANSLLAFTVSDPRLHYPPQTVSVLHDTASQSRIIQVLATWPLNKIQSTPTIFNRTARLAASRTLPSQKSVNRRKGSAIPGELPDPRPTDPQIPILVYASRDSGVWTLLLPWKCVLPIWRTIMHYPLSTGGNPRFGGLEETRQMAFESSRPWFPGDYPGTSAGWAWEIQDRMIREKEWAKRPKGKRIEWESVDLGNGRKGEVGRGWACDWEAILNVPANEDNLAENHHLPRKDSEVIEPLSRPFHHLHSSTVSSLLFSRPCNDLAVYTHSPYLFTAKITLLTRGVPTTCARVYRLPTTNAELRAQWLSLIPKSRSLSRSKNRVSKPSPRLPKDAPSHLQRRAIAANLLKPTLHEKTLPQPGSKDYPVVPGKEDLVGFVTSGNFNLGEGKGTGVANLFVGKVLGEDVEKGKGKERFLCIVREAGQSLGRLAKWEVL